MEDIDSEPTTTMTARGMGSGATTGRNGSHGETGVTPIPIYKSITTPWQPMVQAICGMTKYISTTIPSSTTGTSHSIRLNSIIDVYTTTAPETSDNPTVLTQSETTDAAGSIDYPMYRDYWLTFYNYWTVVACEYRVRFYLISNLFDQRSQLAIYCYHHGKNGPPLSASSNNIPHYIRSQHPNLRYKFLESNYAQVAAGGATATTTGVSNGLNNFVEFDGTWYPGMTPHEVVEDEQAQVWHKATELPPMAEKMTFITQPGPNNGATTAQLAYRMEIMLKYHVQFKDLKHTFHYITQSTAVPAITNINSTETA